MPAVKPSRMWYSLSTYGAMPMMTSVTRAGGDPERLDAAGAEDSRLDDERDHDRNKCDHNPGAPHQPSPGTAVVVVVEVS